MIKNISKNQQGIGKLFDGAIHENRPISFPNKNNSNAYSNLFYWAHVEAIEDGEFGLHPHEGFEIMTFILRGELEHYDTKTQKWTPLKAGGLQIIQAGSGVQHAERYTKGTEAFQIWFDPNLEDAVLDDPDYKDYDVSKFNEIEEDGLNIIEYIGNNSSTKFITEGLNIVKMMSQNLTTDYNMKLNQDKVYSIYVIEGELNYNQDIAEKDTFLIVDNEDHVDFKFKNDTQIFIVESPKRPNYVTYIDKLKY